MFQLEKDKIFYDCFHQKKIHKKREKKKLQKIFLLRMRSSFTANETQFFRKLYNVFPKTSKIILLENETPIGCIRCTNPESKNTSETNI